MSRNINEKVKVGKEIKHWSIVCGGVALLPWPGISLASSLGVEIAMCAGINKITGVDFSKNKLKCVLRYMLSNLAVNIGSIAVIEVLKCVPFVNFFAGIGECVALASCCYAAGWIYYELTSTLADQGKHPDDLSEEELKTMVRKLIDAKGDSLLREGKANTQDADFASQKDEAAKYATR